MKMPKAKKETNPIIDFDHSPKNEKPCGTKTQKSKCPIKATTNKLIEPVSEKEMKDFLGDVGLVLSILGYTLKNLSGSNESFEARYKRIFAECDDKV